MNFTFNENEWTEVSACVKCRGKNAEPMVTVMESSLYFNVGATEILVNNNLKSVKIMRKGMYFALLKGDKYRISFQYPPNGKNKSHRTHPVAQINGISLVEEIKKSKAKKFRVYESDGIIFLEPAFDVEK